MKAELQITFKFNPEPFKNASETIVKLSIALNKIDNRSKFEKFYDFISDKLSNGKSFVPNELKLFR